MGWNYLSIRKLRRCNRWSLGMDMWFHHTFYNGCNYLFMMGLQLIHVSNMGPRFVICDVFPLWYGTGHSRWRYDMETFSALLALCAGNSQVTGKFPFTKASDAKLWCFLWSAPVQTLSKQSGRRWFETRSRSLCRHCNCLLPNTISYMF